MAFVKRTWKDRISEYPNRRTINDGNVTKQVTVGRDEGTVTEEGDAFDATNMNDLEDRIEDAYGDVVALVASEVAQQYSGDVIFDNAPTQNHGVGYAVTSDGVKTALDSKVDASDLAEVATTGDYDDLSNTPHIPVNSDFSAAGLSDVTISSPTQGEALVFDENGNLVNGTVSTVGSIDDLSDVDTTGKGNDYSLVYNSNDAEWQAKKLTVEVTQAEYDQLKLDGDLVEGVHYVITDGQDVTCNLGDLNDVDTSGASTGDILVKGASGWSASTLIGYDTVSGTTSGTGALAYSNDYKDKIIACFYPSNTGILGLVYSRGDGYFTCLDNDRQPRANANVTVGFYYLNV